MERKGSAPSNVKIAARQALPDERLLVTLEDGRSLIVDADRLAPQADGTEVLALTATDRLRPSSSQVRDLDDAPTRKRHV